MYQHTDPVLSMMKPRHLFPLLTSKCSAELNHAFVKLLIFLCVCSITVSITMSEINDHVSQLLFLIQTAVLTESKT